MKTFITENFLLRSETARELYHTHAAPLPIYDYHCHLPPNQIAEDRQFGNLYEVWLAGDHYKWRAMRSNGISEKFCTGDASSYDKFLAFAKTVPFTLRNPLYHWTHLELLRYFGIDELLDEDSAPAIWAAANAQLATPEFRVRSLMQRCKVTVVCTTDDPADDLKFHRSIQNEGTFATKILPTFRPDKALNVHLPEAFNAWIRDLERVSNADCTTFEGFLVALKRRHDYFHELGCRLSDHGLSTCPGLFAGESEASAIYDKARTGHPANLEDLERFTGYMMVYFGQLDADRGWTKQLHIGAQRNNNSRLFREVGPDTGFDSIGDSPQASSLAKYLDALDSTHSLPKMILYNLNPSDNYLFAAMIGNFQDGSLAGKIQFGSGWWFLDQKEAMENQINALSNLGLLSRFVGMLTDSRSFLSYPRHEYFRRILCNLVGTDVENGDLPRDMKLLGSMIEGICYHNAEKYFQL